MSDKNPPRSTPRPLNDGYRPTETRGYKPTPSVPTGTVQNGYQPTTSQAPSGAPPNQGSGGQPAKK